MRWILGEDFFGRSKEIFDRSKKKGSASFPAKPLFSTRRFGGAVGNRTPDLDIANVALYQLSYDPISRTGR
jgi:hypothetical protein